MNLNYKIFLNGIQISLTYAIKNDYAIVSENGLEFSEKLTVYTSSELFDKNGNEIFDHDVLVDSSGNQYDVEKIKGTFFIKNKSNNLGGLSATMSGLKIGNRIINMKIVDGFC